MDLNNYQTQALRTEAPQPTVLARLGHAALGFISETGEIATQVKRIAFYGKTLDSVDKSKNGEAPRTLREHIAEEVGDVMWYMAIAASASNCDVAAVFADLEPTGRSLKSALLQAACDSGNFADFIADADEAGSLAPGDLRVVEDYLGSLARDMVDIADALDISIEQIAADNIAKLQLRYPNAFSIEAAEARADKGGLDARNS